MADYYEVLTESLAKHAGTVDRIADQMAQAAAAGHQMGLPSDAYGLLCVDLPAMLNPLQELGCAGTDGVREAAEHRRGWDPGNRAGLRSRR